MTDAMSESELKREVVETRNQIIKTNNHVTNLGLEIKAFHQRFDALEKKARVSTLGVHVLVATVIGIAAFVVTQVQSASLRGTLEKLQSRTATAESEAKDKSAALQRLTAESERTLGRAREARARATSILEALRSGRETEAVRGLEKLDGSALTALEQSLLDERTADAKKRAAETAYRNAKRALDAGRSEAALTELKRAIGLSPTGRFSEQSRYLLVTTLWRKGEFEALGPHLETLAKTQKDRNILDELNFIRGSSMAHQGKTSESKAILQKLTRSRWAAPAKAYIAAIDGGAPLPPIPGAK